MWLWKMSWLVAVLALPYLWGELPAQERGKAEKKSGEGKKVGEKKTGRKAAGREEKAIVYDLRVKGVLGAPAKGGGAFYELRYDEPEGKKMVRKKVWIRIDSGTQIRRDRTAAVTEFKEGDPLHVFGKPVERESGGRGGISGGKDFRLLQASRVVIGGKDVSVNGSYGDPKDKGFQWCSVKVDKAGPAMTVRFEDTPYKLTLDKPSAVLMREEGELKRDARRGAWVYVEANSISERPEGEKEDREAFHAENLLILEPRALQWYEALIQ